MSDQRDRGSTVHYKKLEDSTTPISFDIYFPPSNPQADHAANSTTGPISIPAMIYFHGGGLTVGNRESWFPTWLYRRVISLGYAFISADYQLLPPATGHDIVQDLQDLFSFLSETEMSSHSYKFKINMDKIAVSGSSAGGLCAYLAAIHCSPKSRALVSMYGMGGNFLTPHYLTPKETPFFRGRELLDPTDFPEYLYPFPGGPLAPLSESHLAYHPQTYHIPGYPANKRMLLARLYLQLGAFLDYYTGMHEPSLSKSLRDAMHGNLNDDRVIHENLIPNIHHPIFPQVELARVATDQESKRQWPPTMLLHGTADTAVPVGESRHMRDLLLNARVSVELVEFEGQEHSFDYDANAEELWGERFDDVKDFLGKWLEVEP